MIRESSDGMPGAILTRSFLILVVTCLLLSAASGVARGAATGTSAWEITVTSQPTNFAPGASAATSPEAGHPFAALPQYYVSATNIGGGVATEPVTITDILPEGVTPIEVAAEDSQKNAIACTIIGQTVACTDHGPVAPGDFVRAAIPVTVSASAPEIVSDRATVSGGGAPFPRSSATSTAVTSAVPEFGFLAGPAGFSLSLTEADGSPAVQAGSHPFQMTVGLGFPTAEGEATTIPAGSLHDVGVTLPRGLVVDPEATPTRCTEAQLESDQVGGGCPDSSQIGTVTVFTNLTGTFQEQTALYNMVAPPGSPAEFGFDALKVGIYVHLMGRVRADGSYELAAVSKDLLARGENPILAAQVSLWGDPSSGSHDYARNGCPGGTLEHPCPRPVERTDKPLLTMPGGCSSSLTATAEADSWQEPERIVGANATANDAGGEPSAVTGCRSLPFDPTLTLKPEVTAAETPTGLQVDLHVPQTTGLENLAAANLKDAKVILPRGLVVNPSAANGLVGCSPAQVDLKGAGPAECPDASKIGTVEVDTPLLDHPLPGSIYVAIPYENPFGSLLALYIAVYDPVTGVVVKLAGQVAADEQTGQLTTSFEENPELPFEDFRLQFFGGARAALRTPSTCGDFSFGSELTPWSGSAAVSGGGSFAISQGANGSACAMSEMAQPNAPIFEAGTTNPLASLYSPFVLHLRRVDGSQVFRALKVGLPQGLVGKLAGIPYCPDSALAAAEEKSGAVEKASPSCPAASEVGTVTVGAGAGSLPLYVQGRAYLAGPYKGAPLSLAIVTPAVAGPYDLGTVVVRSALDVNLRTAQITATSDPIPTILKGIPLDVRSISVELNRSEFTRTPSTCEAMAVLGQLVSSMGSVAPLSNRFQVGGCGDLGFPAKLKLSLKGKTKRTGHPALKAVVTFPKEGAYSNIARAQVGLPHSEFLDQNNLNKTCTRPVLLAGNCPKSTIYGKAKAWTPLLDKPLEGNVYLVGGFGYKLPALVADLNGQIRILLVGKVDTGKSKGIRNTFEVVPDAPVSRFVLEMKGGKKYGLLVNSENLCAKAQKGNARFVAHDGDLLQLHPKIANSCSKHRSNSKRRGHHRSSADQE